MAVYKPTNCQPYLTTFDLLDCIEEQTATLFECKVDTSNREVTAYAMTLYNSENTQIFPVDTEGNPVEPQNNITFVSDLKSITGTSGLPIASSGYINLNSGINGSYLHIPFFVGSAQYNSYSPSDSSVMYNMLRVAQSAEGEITVSATNRVATQSSIVIVNGQQYKWVITLFQGVEKNQETNNPVFPKSIYQYDMIVTTGQVMGSNNERIQSYLSEEIYVDYYVQPVRFNGGITVDDEELGLWHPTISNEEPVPVGSRVMIKNYDSSYGYIYPMTGDSGFAPNTIKKGGSSENANAFQIYTMSNNSEDLTVTRMVAVVPYATVPWTWEQMLSDEGSSNGAQSFYVYVGSDTSIPTTFYPFDTIYEPTLLGGVESNPINQFLQGDTKTIAVTEQARIVLNYQAENNDYYANHLPSGGQSYPLISNPENASPYNGIYTPTISVDSRVQIGGDENDTDNYYRKVTITWRRASDANTWGELSNKVVMVTWSGDGNSAKFGGENIQTQIYDDEGKPIEDQTTVGTLNASPVKFIKEKPIYIYTHDSVSNNNHINDTGIVLYNDDPPTTQQTLATLYVRPYIGLEPMMWIRELGLSDASSRFFLVQSVNTTTWAVKYYPNQVYVGNQIPDNGNGNATSAIFEIGQRYQIRTFYKSSDENPFNLYSNPDISMTFYPSDWVYDAEDNPNAYGSGPNFSTIVIGSRSFVVSATYTQDQYIWWKSFNYTLYDMVGNQLSSSGDKYAGLMQHTFYGLSRGDYYNLVLTVETYSGNVISLSQELVCSFEPSEIGDEFPFNLSFDCDINATRMTFRLTGYIIPNVELEGGGYRHVNEAATSNDTSPSIPGVTYSNRGSMLISYNASATSKFPEEGVTYTHTTDGTTTVSNINPLKSENNTVLVQSSHTVRNENFTGNFISVYFEPDDDSSSLPSEYKLVVYIPEELVEDENGLAIANPDRNKVLYDILGEDGESAIGGPAVATLYTQAGAATTDNKWQNDKYILANWQPAIAAISENLGSASLVNYKPVTQRLSEETSEGLGYDSTQGAILGAFNTTTDYEQRISGQDPVRVPVTWWENSPQRQMSPMMADNTSMLFAQGDPPQPPTATAENLTPSPSDANDDLCYVGIETKHRAEVAGLDRELFTVRGGADNFVIVNKVPVVWGDYDFTLGMDYGTSQNTSFWNIASIHQVVENDSDQTVIEQGFKTRSYFENKEDAFIWNDTSSDGNGNNTRWFDGWGYNNGGDSNQIYVGNQTQVIDANLTNTERSNIEGKTFIIQANVGIELENNQLIHEVSVYYQNN